MGGDPGWIRTSDPQLRNADAAVPPDRLDTFGGPSQVGDEQAGSRMAKHVEAITGFQDRLARSGGETIRSGRSEGGCFGKFGDR